MTAGQLLRSLRTRQPRPTPLPEAEGPAAVAWASALRRPLPDGALVLHERLRVLVVDDERGGAPVEHTPSAWVDDDGVVHADDPVRGLLAALAP